ncbi:Hpt domain-containing protein [Mesorhizobium sp. A623]
MAHPADAARIDLAALDPDGTFPARLEGDRATLFNHARDLWDLEAEALETRLKQIATLAHRLGGSAGTFGFGAIGGAALALEDTIVDPPPGRKPARRRAAIARAIGSLLRELDAGLANP